MAAAIIPLPPHQSKYLRKIICPPLPLQSYLRLALLSGFDSDRGRGEEQTENLAED
jgi:hypothetical protein